MTGTTNSADDRSARNKPGTSNDSNKNVSRVRVGVRVRPLTSTEISQGGKCSLTVDGIRHGDNSTATKTKNTTIAMGPRRRFTYDAVFDSNCSQLELYDCVATPLLTSFVDGYNATVCVESDTEKRCSLKLVVVISSLDLDSCFPHHYYFDIFSSTVSFISSADHGLRTNRKREDVYDGERGSYGTRECTARWIDPTIYH